MGLRTESMISNLQEKLKDIGGESMIMSTQTKLKEIGADEMMHNLQEKLKEIGGESMIMMNSTQTKLKEIGADEMMHNLQKKLKEIGGESMIMMNSTQTKLKEIGADEMMHNLQEKLKNFGLFLMAWLDKVFPPETREERIQHWIHVSAPYVVIGLVLFVLFRFCSRCLLYCSSKAVKMMKAPGMNFLIPRHAFEANPSAYFSSLHSGKLKFR